MIIIVTNESTTMIYLSLIKDEYHNIFSDQDTKRSCSECTKQKEKKKIACAMD